MRPIGRHCLVALALCLSALPGKAQTSSEIQQLKDEIRQLQLRVDALQPAPAQGAAPAAAPSPLPAALAVSASAAPAGSPAPAAKGPEAVQQAEVAGTDTLDAGMGGMVMDIPHLPEMKFRGFGDVRAFIANQNFATINNSPSSPTPATQGGDSTFALGLMDLFITSRITAQFSYLTEVGFEADASTNGIGVDLERAQITYMPGEKFSISAGRTHAMLGYYNTAFHHGTWFQTTIDRPRIFEFEDSGGPLPIHNVGVAAMGALPSGKLGLHWLGEVGNGKQTYSLFAGATPANVLADHNGKSSNIGIFARPDGLPGFQAGFDWYQATLVPDITLLPGYGTPQVVFPNAVSNYHQNLFVTHVVYITPKLELMAEDAEVGDTPRGSSKALYTSGGYVQASRVFGGQWRPYFRYEWINPNFRDPNNAWAGRWVGPKFGVRWDTNAFIALKLEYSHIDWKNFTDASDGTQVLPILHKTINQLGTQITYTF